MPQMELQTPIGFIQAELQRAIDLVSFGLHAADKLETNSLDMPGVWFRFTASQDQSMEVNEAREAFRTWVLGNGLRDCVDVVGPSLEWARKICFLWTREGEVSENEDGSLHLSAKISGKEWNEQMVKEGSEFEYWPLRKKLSFLEDSYGLQIPETSEAVLSISYARNCLTHRRGIVGQEDIREDSSLVVRWKKMELTAHGEDGSRPLQAGSTVHGGETVSFGYEDVSKEFKLGDRIEFTPQEFVQLASTFMLFALQIQNAIQALQESRKHDSQSGLIRL